MSGNYRPIEILVVEDNPGDVRLVTETLRESRITNRLTVVTDGAHALAHCRREGSYSRVARPDLVLLDLNLPKRDGREVLAVLKADADLRRIPVIILTSSHTDQDILAAYGLCHECYLNKPLDCDKFLAALRTFPQFWTTITVPASS